MGNTVAPPAGRLYVYDQFAAAGRPARHGDAVVAAAAQEGLAPDHIVAHSKSDIQMDGGLYAPVADKKQYLQAFKQGVVHLQKSTLEDATGELKRLQADGVHDSAVNFSLGMSKASVVDVYFQKMSLAWDSNDFQGTEEDRRKAVKESEALLDNFAKVHGVKKDDVIERMAVPQSEGAQKLAQSIKAVLAKEVEGALQGDKTVGAAKAEYDQAVVAFEKNHNSVVVAAENSGDISPKGKSADFYDNVLSNSATTTVGAVDAGRGKVESYSNPSKNVTVYAPGQSPIWSNSGTSFASPRMGAALAKAHDLNRQMESAEVEAKVLSELTMAVPGGGRQLDPSKDRAYLSRN